MTYRILALAALIDLAGCSGIVGTSGQITGITIPAGCEAMYSASFPPGAMAINEHCVMPAATATAAVPAVAGTIAPADRAIRILR
jgi:hypothetical protein